MAKRGDKDIRLLPRSADRCRANERKGSFHTPPRKRLVHGEWLYDSYVHHLQRSFRLYYSSSTIISSPMKATQLTMSILMATIADKEEAVTTLRSFLESTLIVVLDVYTLWIFKTIIRVGPPESTARCYYLFILLVSREYRSL